MSTKYPQFNNSALSNLPLVSHCQRNLHSSGVLGLYFSAHWCAPCRAFTPRLSDFVAKYRETKVDDPANPKPAFDVIFVSSDDNAEQFDKYHQEEMNFPAVTFNFERGNDLRQTLAKAFDVQSLPTLIIVDVETGRVIDRRGRDTIMSQSHKSALDIVNRWNGDRLLN